MDPVKNPYTPGAGTRPLELAGRRGLLDDFAILVARLRQGMPEQSQIVKGLRGVGKTVLLNAFEDHAQSQGFLTSYRELTQESSLPALLARDTERALGQLSLGEKAVAAARKALSQLRSFKLAGPGDFGLTITLRDASEDVLADDFAELFLHLGGAARSKEKGVVFLLDEVQFVRETEFRALITALHRAAQKAVPITLAAAGLPQIPRLAGDARSYAERLFRFPEIGRLSDDDARAALMVPAEDRGVTYTDEAVARMLELTAGYPFYIQQFGKHVWNVAAESPITAVDVAAGAPLAEQALDSSLYEVRIQRATERERRYLRAMAELGAGPYRAGDVARKMGVKTTSLSPVRSRLLEKGLIYATENYGHLDFTVPRFDEFMRRYMPYAPPRKRRTPPRPRSRP